MLGLPGQCGLVECRTQGSLAQFPSTTYTGVAGSIPNKGCAGDSQMMFLFHRCFCLTLTLLPSLSEISKNKFYKKNARIEGDAAWALRPHCLCPKILGAVQTPALLKLLWNTRSSTMELANSRDMTSASLK